MNKKSKIIFVLMGIFLLIIAIPVASARSIDPITTCEPIGHAHPICGWQNPEDMDALPNGRFVIVSEYGDQNGSKPGMISLFDLETETRQMLYNGGSNAQSSDWGDSTCSEVAEGQFSPHGIHLSKGADGILRLLVVQHGGRESIEMFEVKNLASGWDLEWRGCVIAPEGSMLNDVVGLPDGGFLVTHMMENSQNSMATFGEYIKGSMLGRDTGYVIEWAQRDGFSEFTNSAGVVPNGIQISLDSQTVFVNYSNGELRRINRLSGEIEASTTDLPPLDNATWGIDGRLLLAGGSEKFADMMGIMLNCMDIEEGICPATHFIIAVDPETLEGKTVYTGGLGTPGGTGTVGLQVESGALLIGTFAGDRIVKVSSLSD